MEIDEVGWGLVDPAEAGDGGLIGGGGSPVFDDGAFSEEIGEVDGVLEVHGSSTAELKTNLEAL